MLVDFPISGSAILVVGGGATAERKVRKLLEERPRIVVASMEFTRGLLSLGARGKVRLVKVDALDGRRSLDRAIAESDFVIVATSDPKANGEVAARARRRGILVNAADNPSGSDFNFPATARAGDVRLAVSTGGRSPVMARLICEKLARRISQQDRLGVELLGQIRDYAKKRLPDPESRKAAMYRVLGDNRVQRLLLGGHLAKARRAAEGIIKGE